MLSSVIKISSRASLRDKARLNICIAKDLADSFGGRKADYLIPLNRNSTFWIEHGRQLYDLIY